RPLEGRRSTVSNPVTISFGWSPEVVELRETPECALSPFPGRNDPHSGSAPPFQYRATHGCASAMGPQPTSRGTSVLRCFLHSWEASAPAVLAHSSPFHRHPSASWRPQSSP